MNNENNIEAVPGGGTGHEQAKAWITRGIALLNTGTPESLREAVQCFDRAIELRKQLPLDEAPEFRLMLAAGLINRGDALARLGGAENLDGAVNSQTEAIAILREIPPDDSGLYFMRLAIAWINRGVALDAKGGAPAHAEAISSFRQAIDLLGGSPHANDSRFALIQAGARINFGNALLRDSGDTGAAAAREAAEQALTLLAGSESSDPAAAEAGLKARHVLCQALVAMLAASQPEDESTRMDLAGKVTDIVEEGLSLTRDWQKRGATSFHALATQLFHVGVMVYERSQPQFLADFVLDYLDPGQATCIIPVDKEWLVFANESLSRVHSRLRISNFELLATGEGTRRLEILKRVTTAQAKLRAMSQ